MNLHGSVQESNTEPETLTVVVNGIEFHESYEPHKMWGLIMRNVDRTNTSFEFGTYPSSVSEELKRKAKNNESPSKADCIILKRPKHSSPGAIDDAEEEENDNSAVEDDKEEEEEEEEEEDEEDEDEDEDKDDEKDDGKDYDKDIEDDDGNEDGADDASRDADPDANLDEDGDDYDYGDAGPLNTADDDEDDTKYHNDRPDTDSYNFPAFEKNLYIGIDPITHCRYAYYQGDQKRVRFEFPATVSEVRKRARKDNNTVFGSIRNEMFRALSYSLSKSRLKTGPVLRPVLLEDGCIRTCCVKRSAKTPSLLSEEITNLCNRCFQSFNDSNFYSWHSHKVHLFCPGSWQNFTPEYALAEPFTSCQFCGFDKGVVEYFSCDDRKFAAHWYCAHFSELMIVDPSSTTNKLCCSLCSTCEGIVSKCPAIGCSVRSHPICALSSGWCCAITSEANKTKLFFCSYHANHTTTEFT